MSDNIVNAENQQERSATWRKSSETTRRTSFTKKEIIAYLQGAIHDASLNKNKRIRFVQKNKEWLEKLQIFLKRIGCNSWIYKEGKDRNVYVLETLCKDLDFKFTPSNLDVKEKMQYVKGFFDAEGGVPRDSGKFYIQLAQKNFRKIQELKVMLSELKIETGKIHNPSKGVNPNYWRIFVSTSSHRRFADVINSDHPLKVAIFRRRMKI